MGVYPNGIFTWNPRIDDVNIVFANDPNQLATEIQGVETIIVTSPQKEQSPPAGNTVTFATMSSRLSAAMGCQLMPYVSLANSNGFFIAQGAQAFNHYGKILDPYNMWNGSDITVSTSGWWSVRADQKWNQHGNNFYGLNILFLYLNGSVIDFDMWDWSTAIAANLGGHFSALTNVVGSNGWSKLTWEGALHAGDRLQILSANATFCPGIQITNMTLKARCQQVFPSTVTFTSG
jgi:hypothetical protein